MGDRICLRARTTKCAGVVFLLALLSDASICLRACLLGVLIVACPCYLCLLTTVLASRLRNMNLFLDSSCIFTLVTASCDPQHFLYALFADQMRVQDFT